MNTRTGPYTAREGWTTGECPTKAYVEGPGNGFGRYGGTLWPDMRFSNDEDAKAAALCCNEAFAQGYARAQADIRKALGLPC